MMFDASQAQWLAVDGVLFDIAGALVLSRAFIWSRPAQLAMQTETRWSGNSDLLKALCEQSVDAQWGAALLVTGFLLQALSFAGVNIVGTSGLTIAIALLPVAAIYFCNREPMIRQRYMAAVDTLATDEDDKKNMREWFDKPPTEK